MVITDTIPGLSGSVFLAAAKLLKPVWTKWEDILKPKEKGDRLKAIVFYIAFGIGTTVGMFGFAQLIQLTLKEIPAITFWFFLTAAGGGILIYLKGNWKTMFPKDMKNKKGDIAKAWLFFAGFSGIIIIMLVMVFVHGRIGIDQIRIEDVKNHKHDISWSNTTQIILICLAGFFSAYAMFTPGLSGGLVVLLFGAFGLVFGGLLAEPFKYFLILVLYGVFVFAGIITAIFTLDKLYKKHPFILTWILFGFVSGSFLAMPVMFDVFIPSESIRWVYIAIGVALSATLVSLTLWMMFKHEHANVL